MQVAWSDRRRAEEAFDAVVSKIRNQVSSGCNPQLAKRLSKWDLARLIHVRERRGRFSTLIITNP